MIARLANHKIMDCHIKIVIKKLIIKVLTKLRVARIVKTAILYLELITRRLIVVIIVLVLTLIIPVLQTLMMRREQVM